MSHDFSGWDKLLPVHQDISKRWYREPAAEPLKASFPQVDISQPSQLVSAHHERSNWMWNSASTPTKPGFWRELVVGPVPLFPSALSFSDPNISLRFVCFIGAWLEPLVKSSDEWTGTSLSACGQIGIWQSLVACSAAAWDVVNKHLMQMQVTTAHTTLVVPLTLSEALMDGGGLRRCPFNDAQTKAEK